nr:hypothetical protein [uncultured Campylobacter sp.]
MRTVNGGIHIVRLAYYTFKRNLVFLFTYESVENLPKTNNSLPERIYSFKDCS